MKLKNILIVVENIEEAGKFYYAHINEKYFL